MNDMEFLIIISLVSIIILIFPYPKRKTQDNILEKVNEQLYNIEHLLYSTREYINKYYNKGDEK